MLAEHEKIDCLKKDSLFSLLMIVKTWASGEVGKTGCAARHVTPYRAIPLLTIPYNRITLQITDLILINRIG